jgi:hypothetical protein
MSAAASSSLALRAVVQAAAGAVVAGTLAWAWLRRREIREAQRRAQHAEFGFERAELGSQALAGDLAAYDAHLFYSTGPDSSASWPERMETTGMGAQLAAARKALGDGARGALTVTAFEGAPGELVLFPHRLRFTVRGSTLSDAAAAALVQLAVQGKVVDLALAAALPPSEPLRGGRIMVCVHAARDRRCGLCGPELVEELRAELRRRGLLWTWAQVNGCSHVGGHKFAGNVLVFVERSASERERAAAAEAKEPGPPATLIGDWYGYITPRDVPAIVDAAQRGLVLVPKWRGTLGLGQRTASLLAKDDAFGARGAGDAASAGGDAACEDCDCGLKAPAAQ